MDKIFKTELELRNKFCLNIVTKDEDRAMEMLDDFLEKNNLYTEIGNQRIIIKTENITKEKDENIQEIDIIKPNFFCLKDEAE